MSAANVIAILDDYNVAIAKYKQLCNKAKKMAMLHIPDPSIIDVRPKSTLFDDIKTGFVWDTPARHVRVSMEWVCDDAHNNRLERQNVMISYNELDLFIGA